MSSWASGKHAKAICDRCGHTIMYVELQAQFINRVDSGLRVCSDCLDIDHEQYDLGRFPVDDPIALRDPRPDRGQAAQRGFFGWNPLLGQSMTASMGTVTVTIT